MQEPLLDVLLGLALDARDHAVFGSAPLYVKGMKTSLRDLDVIARGAAWTRVVDLSERGLLLPPEVPSSGRGLVVRHPCAAVEVFDDWTAGTDVNVLIDAAEMIDGIPFVLVGDVLAWKARSGREKDRLDVEAVDRLRGRTSRLS
jgi:hypothetical protein